MVASRARYRDLRGSMLVDVQGRLKRRAHPPRVVVLRRRAGLINRC